MEALYEQLKRFYTYLIENKILQTKKPHKPDYYDLLGTIHAQLKAAYPQTKFKRIMKSVHYANGFPDLRLKEASYLLDEIEQLLCFHGFLDHDEGVEFFNELAIKRELNPKEPCQIMLEITKIAIESLMYPALRQRG